MGKPFIKLIQSPYAYYFFDVNKNQIVRVPEETYRNLEKILDGKETEQDNTIERLKKLGYLSDFHVKKIEHPDTKNIKKILNSKMKILILQITQNCNFRCSYCIYSNDYKKMQRSHSSNSMSAEVAKAAIDYFVKHSNDTKNPLISFYGGEPLLEFEKIEKIVLYAKEKFKGKKITFTFTTNGSLLNEKIVEFCRDNKIYFMLSLDGPESIQNINRRFASNGQGSFEIVQSNFKRIKDWNLNFFSQLFVNMVIDRQNDYDDIVSIFQDVSFNGVKNFLISDIDDLYSLEKTIYTNDFRKKEEYQKFRAYIEYFETGEYTGKNYLSKQAVVTLKGIKSKYEKISRLPENGMHAGPCIPGQTKLFVNVFGDFFPCERVSELSECMKIGNVLDGIDEIKVKNLINIGQLIGEKCKQCWAFLHCHLCARYADECGTLSGKVQELFCGSVCDKVEQEIRDYIMIKECEGV